MRRCTGNRGIAALALIGAGIVLLLIALPMRFWTAALGIGLIAAGIFLLRAW